MKKSYIVLSTLALIVLMAACSSPAVTGMKVHIQNGEYGDAVHLADSVIAEGDSLNAALWFYRGQAQYNLSDWEGACESFDKVDVLDIEEQHEFSTYWGAYYNAASYRLVDGDVEGAKFLLERGTELMPLIPDFYLMLGDIALNLEGDLDVALSCFNTAWVLDENEITSLEESIAGTSDPSTLYYLEEDLNRAVTIGIQALYNSGIINRMKADMAAVDERAGYIQAAIDAYESALNLDPTSIDVLKSLAETHLISNDFVSAISVYDEALLNIEIGVEEGWVLPEDAQVISANILVSKGFALIEMDRYEDGIAELNRARGFAGDDYIVLATLAHAWFTMEEYDEALAVLDETIILAGLTDDEYANSHYMVFACYNRLEDDESAAAALETALEFTPENGEYWGYLASTYSRLGRRNDAIEAMEKAAEYGN